MCSFHTFNAQKSAPPCQSLGWQCLGSELCASSVFLVMEKWAQRKVWSVHTRHRVLGLAFTSIYWPWSLSHVLLFCNPMDCCSPDSSVHRIPLARILEWVAIPSPGDLPNPGIEPGSPALQEGDSLPSEPPGKCIPYRALGAVVLRLMLHSSIAQILPVWVYTAVNRSVCPHGVHIPGGEADKEGSNKSSEEQLRSSG